MGHPSARSVSRKITQLAVCCAVAAAPVRWSAQGIGCSMLAFPCIMAGFSPVQNGAPCASTRLLPKLAAWREWAGSLMALAWCMLGRSKQQHCRPGAQSTHRQEVDGRCCRGDVHKVHKNLERPLAWPVGVLLVDEAKILRQKERQQLMRSCSKKGGQLLTRRRS